MSNMITKTLEVMQLNDKVAIELSNDIQLNTVTAQTIAAADMAADSISVNDIIVSNDISIAFTDGLSSIELSSVKEFMLKKPDSTIKFASPNPVENQAIAEAIQRQKYDIMIAQEGINQVARRVKVLEDATQPIPVCCDLSICTPEDLSAFALSVQNGIDFDTKTVVLARNIDLQDYPDFPTIGTLDSVSATQFAGTFDGQHHCILNFTLKSDASIKNVGLFPRPKQAKNSKIKDLNLINFNINVPNAGIVGCVAGALFEYAESHDYCILDNITASGTLVAANTCGGLVGNFYGQMKNCSFTGFMSGGHRVFGGLVGKNLPEGGHIINCKANGMIDAVRKSGTDPVCIGGLVGSLPNANGTSSFDKCYSNNNISGCYSNMLIRYDDGQTRTTVDYLPIIGAMPKDMTDANYETFKDHVKDNSWNTDIYTAEKFYLHDPNGNDFDKKYELPN